MAALFFQKSREPPLTAGHPAGSNARPMRIRRRLAGGATAARHPARRPPLSLLDVARQLREGTFYLRVALGAKQRFPLLFQYTQRAACGLDHSLPSCGEHHETRPRVARVACARDIAPGDQVIHEIAMDCLVIWARSASSFGACHRGQGVERPPYARDEGHRSRRLRDGHGRASRSPGRGCEAVRRSFAVADRGKVREAA